MTTQHSGSKHLDLAQALGNETSDKRIEILSFINEFGSISEAARMSGMSYKAAWQAIDTLNNLAGKPLVEKTVGGSGGGGACLTKAGKTVLEGAALLAQARASILSQLEKHNKGSIHATGFASLSLRTSMRNNLPCTVTGIKKTGSCANVMLDLGNNHVINAKITKESVQLLGLKVGTQVLALCKATGVAITHEPASREGCNVLGGRVTRASRAASGGELTIELASGQQLIGICGPDMSLKAGMDIHAVIEESAIVIALAS